VRLREISTDARFFFKKSNIFSTRSGTEVTAAKPVHRQDAERVSVTSSPAKDFERIVGRRNWDGRNLLAAESDLMYKTRELFSLNTFRRYQ
jgi:hypothetical protein